MSRRPGLDDALLRMVGSGALPAPEKVHLIQASREGDEAGFETDLRLVELIEGLERRRMEDSRAAHQAREAIGELEAIVRRLSAPPWFPGVLLSTLDTPEGLRVRVLQQTTERVIGVADGVDLAGLGVGDEVYLSPELSAVVGVSPDGPPRYGETARFERLLADGRAEVRVREESHVARLTAYVDPDSLEAGDLVRFDPRGNLVFERLDRAEGKQFFITEAPDIDRSRLGGQHKALERMIWAMTASLAYPDLAKQYKISGEKRILLDGPPGNGKTTLARIAAAEISRMTGQTCQFAVVKPGEFEDPYVGVTQQRIRACFTALKAAAGEGGMAALFLDEVESIARHRGSINGQHSDKFLAALLAEVEGFERQLRLVIISATNRPDLLDSAARARLGEVEIHLPAPTCAGAREIFAIHLDPQLPYHPNGKVAAATREELIDTAVGMLYARNADTELSRLRFRDGKTEVVRAEQLISGRLIEQVCKEACDRGFHRHALGGGTGVRADDMVAAVSDALDKLSGLLRPSNVRSYLAGLEDDNDVVAVERLRAERRVSNPHLYRVTAGEELP
ncbi:MAG: AAA family ATPase [Armatimonadetes bacterium]|nr:AAA family ATPase [Armatimonadota bacterium]